MHDGDCNSGSETHLGTAQDPNECQEMCLSHDPTCQYFTMSSGGSGSCYYEASCSSYSSSSSWEGYRVSYIDNEGIYSWTDGSNYDYNNWYSGEPNGGSTENCIEISSGLNQQWNDVPCTNNLYFLCNSISAATSNPTTPSPITPATPSSSPISSHQCQWNDMLNTQVNGLTGRPAITTFSECQTACCIDTDCNVFAFAIDPNYPDTKCWYGNVNPQGAVSNTWHSYEKIRYSIIYSQYSYSDAVTQCASLGWKLATLHSYWDYAEVEALCLSTTNKECWLGGFRVDTYNNAVGWSNIDGSPWDYEYWFTNGPGDVTILSHPDSNPGFHIRYSTSQGPYYPICGSPSSYIINLSFHV